MQLAWRQGYHPAVKPVRRVLACESAWESQAELCTANQTEERRLEQSLKIERKVISDSPNFANQAECFPPDGRIARPLAQGNRVQDVDRINPRDHRQQ